LVEDEILVGMMVRDMLDVPGFTGHHDTSGTAPQRQHRNTLPP